MQKHELRWTASGIAISILLIVAAMYRTSTEHRPNFTWEIGESLFGLSIVLTVVAVIIFSVKKELSVGIKESVTRFFFSYEDGLYLGVFRFLYCGYMAYELFANGSTLPRGQYYPIPIFELLSINLADPLIYKGIHHCVVVTLIFSSLGLLSRVFLPLSTILFFLYKGTHLSFSKSPFFDYAYHSNNIVVFVLLILSLSAASSSFVYNWKKRKFVLSSGYVPSWPSKLIVLYIGIVYFAAGFIRLIFSGLWLDGYTLQAYLIEKYLYTDNQWTYWLSQHFWLCVLSSFMTILVELFYIRFIFHDKLKWIVLLTALGFHTLIYIFMDINFFIGFLPAYLIYTRWLIPKSLSSEPDKLIYKPRLFEKAVIVGFVCLSVLPVFLRIEYWPISDYRVFQERTHLEKQPAYRLLGIKFNGEKVWLSGKRRIQNVSRTTFSRVIRDAVYVASEEELNKVINGYINLNDPRVGSMYSDLVVIERSAEIDKDGEIKIKNRVFKYLYQHHNSPEKNRKDNDVIQI